MAVNLPPGYQLDNAPKQPSLPEGYVLDNPKSPPYSPMDPNEPGLQDVSVPDAMAVQGVAGLTKGAIGLGARALGRGAGAALDAISPNIVPSIEETANSQLLKSLGTSPGQIKGLMAGKSIPQGVQAVQDAAAVGRKAGLDDILSLGKTRRDALSSFLEQHGKNIGDLREEAGTATPGLLDQATANISPKYTSAKPDVFSNQASDVPLAQNTVSNIAGENPTNAGIAKGITGLNKFAAGPRANLPANALTDYAGEASNLNDAEITQKLGAEKGLQYSNELHDESGAFHLQPAITRGFQRETAGRGGKGLIMGGIQKLADLGGNRVASKGLDSLHGALTADINAPEALAGMAEPAAKAVGGISANIMGRIQTNPQSLGKYASALINAAKTGGSDGVAATHYILSTTDPAYNAMMQEQDQ